MVRACQILSCVYFALVEMTKKQDTSFCKDIFLPVPPGGQVYLKSATDASGYSFFLLLFLGWADFFLLDTFFIM